MADQQSPREINRDELYRSVWQTPMSRLASEYGITGNGLAKICDRLKIPYPTRGYWAKKAAGKNVKIAQLPPADDKTPSTVTVTPTPKTAKAQELPQNIRALAETARVDTASISVPDRLLQPHSILANWLEKRERKRLRARQERDPHRRKFFDPGEWSSTDKRRHRILDSLLKALEKQGGAINEDRKELVWKFQGVSIRFQLREKQKQVRRQLQEGERWLGSNGWQQELVPTGTLAFSIKTYLPHSLRHEWTENQKKGMETLLPDIIATFVTAVPLLVEQRRQSEEQQRQWKLDELRRYEERQAMALDANRWRKFLEFAQQSRQAENAKKFLDLIKAKCSDREHQVAGVPVADWITWVEHWLIKADPLHNGIDHIFEAIARSNAWDVSN